MGHLTPVQEALARGDTVPVTVLVELEFASSTQRFRDGIGLLTTSDGRTWIGLTSPDTGISLLSMSGLSQAQNAAAPTGTLTLSGVTQEILDIAVSSESEVKDRPMTAYLQFLTDDGAPLGDPVAFYSGLMDVMSFAGSGPRDRTISVTVESLFVNRIRSPFSYYTDRDQQGRFSGDRGMEFTASLISKTVPWLYS